MDLLFDDNSPLDAGHAVVAVAVNANVWSVYDYRFPSAMGEPFVGQRVRVPLGRGNRRVLGFVTAVKQHADPGVRLKPIAEKLDVRPQLIPTVMELGRWISDYYVAPLGMTLAAMLPSSVGAHRPKLETIVRLLLDETHWPNSLGLRQRRILDELFEAAKQGVDSLGLGRLLTHSGGSRASLNSLVKRGLIATESRPVTLESMAGHLAGDPHELNEDQQSALTSLQPKLAGGFSATLLHGVTGSGKTEVYIRAIREVIKAGKQAILLTPEISLATQTLTRLADRLPRVAVLHSGMTPSQRAFYWSQIRDGHASVVVGPRSAIFAPAPNLGLIIVDEEHESSYKQDTAPRYHGRDVAVKRAALEEIPIILGSATPSMETYHNVQQGRYDCLALPNRVRNLPMPTLELVHLRKEMTRGKLELIGATLTQRMATALDRDEQVILLMNRRGYASYVFCPSCQWTLDCDDCLRPMVYHQPIQLAVCHHCDHRANVPDLCPACGGKIILFGYGIQRIEDELARKFPIAHVARMDSDTMTSPKQFQQVLGSFESGETDILLGTQMVAKGLDFPNVSLVGVVSADTALAIPDFRASERTFQMIVQVAGRAGRGDRPGRVVVQTLYGGDPAIQFAEHHDYAGFAELELETRQEMSLPPFGRLVRIVLRHEQMAVVEESAIQLARKLRALLPAAQVSVGEPQPAEFLRIRKQFRFQIVCATHQPGLVQRVLREYIPAWSHEIKADLAIDCDPLNLL